MKRLWVPLLLPFLACQAAQSQEDVDELIAAFENGIIAGIPIQGEPVVKETLEQRLEHLGVPAVSIAVMENGVIEWAKAYGLADVAEGRSATPNTLFQAASISKPVAATAALKLVDEGMVTLDQDVNELLRSWQVPENRHVASERVTLRRLVTHSAGMTVHGFPGYSREERIPTTVEVLDGAGNTDPIRVDTTPGGLWRYSGGGYTVMQLLVTDLTRQPFPEVLYDWVLRPFGMILSTYEQPLSEGRHSEAATAYRVGGAEVEHKWHVYPEMAAAGLWTTPSDLIRFALGILDAYHGRSNGVLSQKIARAMLTPGIRNHGLGPAILADGAVFGHGGTNEGYRCQLYAYIDTGDGVAVMTNSDNGDVLNQEIINTLAELYDWPALKAEARAVAKVEPGLLEELVGRYDITDDIVVVLEVVDGRLWADVTGRSRQQLLPESESAFFGRADGTEVFFVRENGRVVALVVEGARAERRQ
jgi:CubicO group peptidase (beta-lactamase class C family)